MRAVFGPLTIFPANGRAAVIAVLGSIGLVTAVILAAALAWKAAIPVADRDYFTAPGLATRIAYLMVRAAIEEMVYRLGVMSALIAFAGLFWQRLPKWVPVAAILLAQAVSVAVNVSPPHDLAGLLYAAARDLFPGLVWGWLYWRHGFASAVAGHAGVHIVLQPLLLITLAAS